MQRQGTRKSKKKPLRNNYTMNPAGRERAKSALDWCLQQETRQDKETQRGGRGSRRRSRRRRRRRRRRRKRSRRKGGSTAVAFW